jgi:hypothetical protein
MQGGDVYIARQGGTGAGELEDTVVGEGGEPELAHGGAHELLAGVAPDISISSHEYSERM